MDTLYIVMPAYNEEENIRSTLDAWYPVIEEHNQSGLSRLVVVNDGSKDNTYQVMQEYAQDHPLFVPLTKANGGHGSTVIYAYDYAVKSGADWIFQTDSDGQTNPAEFEAFWNDREQYDGIFGNRTARGDGKSRAFVEKVVCRLVRHYFGVKVPDANAPFRLMRADVVKKYLGRFRPDYNLPNIMMTTFFVYYKERTAFKEISFKPREKGTNSINIKKIVKIGWNSLKDFREFKKNM
ncbi:MAG: glycosyltransferase family 2 protein [Clostridia bacterium]|nr:glycosyltransferase family 2 protein [Clostridia bacterium]